MPPFALLLLLAAAPKPPPTPEDPLRCGTAPGIAQYLEIAPTIARQGARLAITPKQHRGYMGSYDVPLDCTSDWTLSDRKLAKLSKDRRTLTIRPDAAPGAVLTIAYKVRGQPVRAQVTIVGRDQVVLAGTRGQVETRGCERHAPVRELVFTTEGRFSVTFTPFETYNDYWGGYTFDPATGAIAFTVTGGNYRPPALDLEGRASLDPAGSLVLEGVYLGDRSGSPAPVPAKDACTYVFR
ncbi:hypothetical protein E2493_19190 [Sphingomonas parva]|uniref:Uncharacterized protein n=1 Tax=Sphingomonas parva TaxID=2555898 RepID=A0A4Y8ZMF4_9SPHN|nr:hypothetical protein [Sphingomonas parva]TFI56637.1 hypothetical protein E2493_19190 [Sphingomonas parva]